MVASLHAHAESAKGVARQQCGALSPDHITHHKVDRTHATQQKSHAQNNHQCSKKNITCSTHIPPFAMLKQKNSHAQHTNHMLNNKKPHAQHKNHNNISKKSNTKSHAQYKNHMLKFHQCSEHTRLKQITCSTQKSHAQHTSHMKNITCSTSKHHMLKQIIMLCERASFP